MVDAFRPLTLLFAAVCLWAVSVLVLSFAGLGSRFSAATSQAKPPPLPVVSLVRSHSRLGPYADYLEVGQRPLLTQDRRPAAQMALDGQSGAADLDVVLTSVLITPSLRLAILTDNKDARTRRVRVGELVEGSNWRLVQLEPRQAIVEGPAGQRILNLRVFDGKGGEAPTQVVASAPGVAGTIASNDGSNADGDASSGAGQSPAGVAQPARPRPEPEASAQQGAQGATNVVTPDQQVEAIRRRIEARRAQMRAEAAAAAAGANER